MGNYTTLYFISLCLANPRQALPHTKEMNMLTFEDILPLVKQGIAEMTDAELVLYDYQQLGLLIISELHTITTFPDVNDPDWDDPAMKAFRESTFGPFYTVVGLPVQAHVQPINPDRADREVRALIHNPTRLVPIANAIRQTLLENAESAAKQTADEIAQSLQ